MTDMLSGVSVVCFAASYLVTLTLEISRFFFRAAVRNIVMIGFAAAGLLAHTVYLVSGTSAAVAQGEVPSFWYFGCLLVAWLLVLGYLISEIRDRTSTVGLFVLPTTLILIVLAHLFSASSSTAVDRTFRLWSITHGMALLIGSALVVVGFVAGLMYLIQSYRLKHKMPPKRGLWVPSLERLQRLNEGSLLCSILLLGAGLTSGILLNLVSHGAVPWNDPIVWASAVWLVWLLAALAFNGLYPPARVGRKVAYLTVGSFVFLGIVLGILLLIPSQHTATGQLRHLPFPLQDVTRQTAGFRPPWDAAERAAAAGGEQR